MPIEREGWLSSVPLTQIRVDLCRGCGAIVPQGDDDGVPFRLIHERACAPLRAIQGAQILPTIVPPPIIKAPPLEDEDGGRRGD